MKNSTKIIAAMMVCFVLVMVLRENETVPVNDLYLIETYVTSTNTETDAVITETVYGNLYVFNGVEDWLAGDRCILIMDDKGTETVADDEIVRTFYRR